MRTQDLVGMASLLIWGVASAQTNLPTVEVRANTAESVMVSCADPKSVTAKDIERVLSIDDSGMTRSLRTKFISAVTDACKAGIPHIQVMSKANGELKWKQMD